MNEVINCPKCGNHGYYQMGVSGKKDEILNMFCVCREGRNLKKLAAEWRLSDLKKVSDETLTRLKIIKSSLHDSSKAGQYLDALIDDTEKVIQGSEKALEQISKEINERRTT